MTVIIGNQQFQARPTETVRSDLLTIRINPSTERYIILQKTDFEQIMINLGLSEILSKEPTKKSGKEYAKYLRSSGSILAELLKAIVLHPEFKTSGIVVGFLEQ